MLAPQSSICFGIVWIVPFQEWNKQKIASAGTISPCKIVHFIRKFNLKKKINFYFG
jgi:hypothetical protein